MLGWVGSWQVRREPMKTRKDLTTMTNIEAYKRTIEIMSDLTEDIANNLLTEIAKSSPATLVRAYDKLQRKDPLAEVKALIRDGEKISAIKAYRTLHPHVGLAGAKEAVERMM